MRAREGGEAGRRLVTQQNARVRPPRLRSRCFQALRGFLETSTEGAGPPLLRDLSRARPSPQPSAARFAPVFPGSTLALASRWPPTV